MPKSGYELTEEELDQEIEDLIERMNYAKGKNWVTLLEEGY